MYAAIRGIDYYLPSTALSNEQLVREFPNWSPEKIEAKTGIQNRYLAGEKEYASDLAVEAGRKLLAQGGLSPGAVDFLILCTQSPDYLLPTTACLVQDRLGLPRGIGALDVNLGCSGFIYGLSLAKGLIETSQARCVLLLTCDTYSKFMDPKDFSVRALFGDGAAATLIRAESDPPPGHGQWIGPFVFGTDGSGSANFICRGSGTHRPPTLLDQAAVPPRRPPSAAEQLAPSALHMDGPEIFTFTLRVVPDTIGQLLQRSHLKIDDVDRFVFHQSNRFMLEHLRQKMGIPAEKFLYAMHDCGNTTSSSIPITLARARAEGQISPGHLVMLVGFGVGYSWGATLARWA